MFCSYKPFYVSKPTEKEKESCLCIDCLNPDVVLKSIKLVYKDDNSLFPEKENDKEVHYYVYELKAECYKGNDRNDV